MEKQLLQEAIEACARAEKAIMNWRRYNPTGGYPSWDRLEATREPLLGVGNARFDLEARLQA